MRLPRVMSFSLEELYGPLVAHEVKQTVRLDKGSDYYQVGKVYRVWWMPRSVSKGRPIGLITVVDIERKAIDELTMDDAVRGGFRGPKALEKLREALSFWYDDPQAKFLVIKFVWLEEERVGNRR